MVANSRASKRQKNVENDDVASKFKSEQPLDSNDVTLDSSDAAGLNENRKTSKFGANGKTGSRQCPYLGTINRHLLDFDSEKVCSITMSNQHVYACLVCGKYFQGRGKSTHCYTHALEQGHYVYMNLHDCQVYCLPENYLVQDTSLDDIKRFLKPTYTPEQVKSIDLVATFGKSLDGADFIPGGVGLNNLKCTDCFNVVIHALCTVAPLRNHLLLMDLDKLKPQDAVVTRLAQLIRKIFNPKNFKGIVSPHELLQAIGVASNGVYKIGNQFDPIGLLLWLLQRLHAKLSSPKGGLYIEVRDSALDSIVSQTFEGQLIVRTHGPGSVEPVVSYKSFRMLTLDIPAAPIFKDAAERTVIPQIPIFDLLSKFDGEYENSSANGPCTFKLYKLPQYLIFHLKRFAKNNFFMEKNGTIVAFPMKNLNLGPYLDESSPDFKDGTCTKYDLVANICHQGKPVGGTYKIHVQHAPTGDWYEIEDLIVRSVLPQFVALAESYIQVYKRQDVGSDSACNVGSSSTIK